MITLQPPPERDLPPGRHAAIRDEILRGIAAQRLRPVRGPRAFDVRRHFLPILAAAGVIAVMCASVAVLAVTRHDRTPTPAASVAPKPTLPPVVPVPGFTDAQRQALRDSCVTDAKNETPLPGDRPLKLAKDTVDLDSMRLLNATSRKSGTVAFLGNGAEVVVCSWGSKNYKSSMPPTGGFYGANFTVNALWLPGALGQDYASSLDNGKEQYLQLAGRVNSGATQVRVIANAGTDKEASTTVAVVNRTYALFLDYQTYNEAAPHVLVQALDANGKTLGELGRNTGPHCYVDPTGAVVYGYRMDNATCGSAVPWR